MIRREHLLIVDAFVPNLCLQQIHLLLKSVNFLEVLMVLPAGLLHPYLFLQDFLLVFIEIGSQSHDFSPQDFIQLELS